MEITKLRNKINETFHKYKYAALIVVIGIALMLIPARTENKETPIAPAEIVKTSTVSQELEEILRHVAGAGRVEVMLTLSEGEQTIYQTDQDISTSDGNSNCHSDTVTVTDAQRQQSGLIQQVNPPTYLGAIVVCDGADSASVRLSVVEAVSKVTGLGADRISVLKMN